MDIYLNGKQGKRKQLSKDFFARCCAAPGARFISKEATLCAQMFFGGVMPLRSQAQRLIASGVGGA